MNTKQEIASTLKMFVVSLFTVLTFYVVQAYAWTAPAGSPPSGNVAGPITTSATAQTKTGALTVGGLTTSNINGLGLGSTMRWSDGNAMYSDGSNVAATMNGWFYVMNRAVNGYTDVVANDYYIGSMGKWVSQLGGSSGSLQFGGFYGIDGGCVQPNPATHGCSCPSGFTAQFAGNYSVNPSSTSYICWK